MKRKPILRNPKQEIINRARKGDFDRNPLLATPHRVVCKTCGFPQKITYLGYRKSGRFELGKTRMVEVSYAAPNIFGLRHTVEKITPIRMTIRCKRCGTEIQCSPVSLEYLLFTTTKQYPEMKTAEGLEEAKKENVDELVIITDHPPAGLLTIPQRLEQSGYTENENYTVKKEGSTWTFRVKVKEGQNVSTG